jgi:ribosomal protein S6
MSENENSDKNESIDEIERGEPKVYEVGYLLVPKISEEEMPAIYGNLKELIASLGGKMISDEMPIMINLAYTMQKTVQNVRNKYNTAYFGWMKFYLDTNTVSDLKKKLDLDANIIRFLILKTVKENTIAAKRFVHRDISRRKTPVKKTGENEEVIPINKEEIDKEIDAMVAN